MAEQTGGHPRRWLILSVLCLALLMVLLDNTVLNVALPSITSSLDATTAQLQWMVNAYTLVLAGLMMATGSLADRVGRKRVLVLGLVVFTACSGVAAFAGSPAQLILARIGMGIGAAFLMPSTLAVLVQIFDDEERPKAIAIWTAVASGAIALGPVVGGFLLDHFWWGSVFLINIPIGVLAVVAMVLLVPESRDPRTRRPDLPGVALSAVMAIGLVYAVISVPEHGWASTGVLVPLAVGLGAGICFVVWERRAADPMLDLSLFRNAKFTGAVGSGALSLLAMAGSLFLLTQYLQFVLGYTPLQTGFAVIPMALAVIAATPLSPKASARVGAPATVTAGLVVMAVGLFVLSLVSVDSGYLPTVVGLLVVGTGIGIALPAASTVLMSAIPPERAGMAGGLNSTTQEFGSALGVAVLGSLMSARFADELPGDLPAESARSVGLALEAAAGAPDPAGAVAGVREAAVSGISSSLVVGSVAALAAGVVAWVMLRSDSATRQDEPAAATPEAVSGA
jgi:EmrB/QacA subfamily drug resistance transporter